MVKEKEKIPASAKSIYICRNCGQIFFLEDVYMGEQLMCLSCGENIIEKVRPKTRTVLLAV